MKRIFFSLSMFYCLLSQGTLYAAAAALPRGADLSGAPLLRDVRLVREFGSSYFYGITRHSSDQEVLDALGQALLTDQGVDLLRQAFQSFLEGLGKIGARKIEMRGLISALDGLLFNFKNNYREFNPKDKHIFESDFSDFSEYEKVVKSHEQEYRDGQIGGKNSRLHYIFNHLSCLIDKGIELEYTHLATLLGILIPKFYPPFKPDGMRFTTFPCSSAHELFKWELVYSQKLDALKQEVLLRLEENSKDKQARLIQKILNLDIPVDRVAENISFFASKSLAGRVGDRDKLFRESTTAVAEMKDAGISLDALKIWFNSNKPKLLREENMPLDAKPILRHVWEMAKKYPDEVRKVQEEIKRSQVSKVRDKDQERSAQEKHKRSLELSENFETRQKLEKEKERALRKRIEDYDRARARENAQFE